MMKKLNLKMLAMLFIAFTMSVTFVACDDDDEPAPAGPRVTAPANLNVESGATADMTFTYSAPGGFQSSNLEVINGSATVKTDGADGATSGDIVVTFTADAADGAASVKLSVTDKNGQVDDATAVMNVGAEVTVISVSSNITADQTWETGKIYILETRISVEAGATLTIEPGVIVKGESGSGENATALLIARGGKLMAEGTVDAPIIFTTIADEIEPGMIASPNLDETYNGLWGGLIVLGNAPISADESPAQIEGIPPSDQNGLYGGDDPADNSGVIKYVSIRHGGANIGEGNEINGLTLGGVGSGTVVENIEIVANQDDGIEWFGGTVSVKNAVVWNTGDDAIDTDQSWSGTLDNFIVVTPGDECFELDGPEGSMEGTHTIINGTVLATIFDGEGEIDRAAQGLVDLDDNSLVTMNNIYFFGLSEGQDFDSNPAGLTVSSLQATIPAGFAVTDFFKEGVDAVVTEVEEGANSVGADASAFSGWAWSAVTGGVDGF